MKFNLKLDSPVFKNSIIVILLSIIIFSILCILDKFLSSYLNKYESFANNIDCSNCEMKPTSGNCINLKNIEISYNSLKQDSSFIIYTDSSYVFCPWESNCTGNEYVDDLVSKQERINLSNEQLKNDMLAGKNNIVCCSGVSSNFYSNNTLQYNNIEYINEQLEKCFPDFSNNQYCQDISYSKNKYYNMTGILFEKQIKSTNKYSDNKLFSNISGQTISEDVYNYKLVNQNSNNLQNEYLLNENQFLDCFGNVKNVKESSGNTFDLSQINKFNNDDYFDIADGATYTTVQDNVSRPYPSREDLEMELRNLPPVNQTGNAPVGVINQYLSAINSFYEKQMANMMGPSTHSFNQELEFDNNTLDTKEKTFFVYNNEPNNEYQCQPSITGNSKFKYCGPPAYYKELQE